MPLIYFNLLTPEKESTMLLIGFFVYFLRVGWVSAGKSYWRERLSAVDLLVLISLDLLLLILKRWFTFLQTSYLNEEVNRTEPSPSVSVPWINTLGCLSNELKSFIKDLDLVFCQACPSALAGFLRGRIKRDGIQTVDS